MGAFGGLVYPFTNDPSKPISDYAVKLPAGDYILETIAHDEDGQSYVVQQSAYRRQYSTGSEHEYKTGCNRSQ